MAFLNIDNSSKILAFKKCKCPIYKYYHKFAKAYKKYSKRLDIRQFLVVLYDCFPNMKHFLTIGRLLKNANILKSGTGKNPATGLYSQPSKLEKKISLKKAWKMQKW